MNANQKISENSKNKSKDEQAIKNKKTVRAKTSNEKEKVFKQIMEKLFSFNKENGCYGCNCGCGSSNIRNISDNNEQ